MSSAITARHCSSFFSSPLLKKNRWIAVTIALMLIPIDEVRSQCSVSNPGITADTIIFCHAPFTVTFTSQSSRDTTPVLLNSYTSPNNFQGPFTFNFPTQNNGCAYYMMMNGTAGLWLGTNRADAYGKYNGTNNSPYGPPGLSNWFLNIMPLSGLSAYNPAHNYKLDYIGDGNTITFSFFDNPYNDNSGLVTFDWYGIPCYRYDWDFGDGSTSTQRDPVHTYQDPGTYTVKLRITDLLSNCSAETTITLCSVTAPTVQLGADRQACAGDTIILATGISNAAFTWQDNSTSADYTVTQEGIYYVQAANHCGTSSDTVTIDYDDIPSFSLGPDTLICKGNSITLIPGTVQSSGNSYLWQDGSTNPTLQVDSEGTYSLTITNACGSLTDDIAVTSRYCNCRLIMPTAFSPDNDGFNDTFLPIIQCDLAAYDIRIYNRLGEMVYQADDPLRGWDGIYKRTPQPMDTYSYIIVYSYSNIDDLIQDDKFTGQVMLLK